MTTKQQKPINTITKVIMTIIIIINVTSTAVVITVRHKAVIIGLVPDSPSPQLKLVSTNIVDNGTQRRRSGFNIGEGGGAQIWEKKVAAGPVYGLLQKFFMICDST